MKEDHNPSLTSPLVLPLSNHTTARSKGRNHLFAGSAGGLVASGLLQPFDVVKTRIQQGQHGSLGSVIRATVGVGRDRRVSRLWRGTLPSILRSSVGSGLYFFTLNEMRQHFSRRVDEDGALGTSSSSSSSLPVLSGQMNLLTGATARATVGFLMMPITIIKVRYESDLYAYRSMFHAGREIYAAHGLKGFFYGFGATAIRDAPYAGLYVYVYEASKAHLSTLLLGQQGADDSPRAWQTTLLINFSSGLTAGFGATLTTNPFDVLRTRMQLRPNLYRNVWTAAKKLYLEEGARSFLDGVGLRIARKSVSSAFTWSLYEFVLASI